jgi:hypothetical protein
MVDPAWLAGNRNFNVPGRIIDNGRAWGDARDPEEIAERQKAVKEEKALVSQKAKMRMALANVGVKEKRPDKLKKGKGKDKAVEQTNDNPSAGTNINIDPRLLDDDDIDYD